MRVVQGYEILYAALSYHITEKGESKERREEASRAQERREEASRAHWYANVIGRGVFRYRGQFIH
jgi:hypothetical protein